MSPIPQLPPSWRSDIPHAGTLIQVVESTAVSDTPLTVAEIVGDTGLDVTTVRRACAHLTRAGYLVERQTFVHGPKSSRPVSTYTLDVRRLAKLQGRGVKHMRRELRGLERAATRAREKEA